MIRRFNTFHIFVLVILVLVILNFLNIRIFDMPLFYIANYGITLTTILVLSAVFWAFRYLPSPFREVLLFLLLLWILSVFGGFLFFGVSKLLLFILILFVLIALIGI